MAVEVQSADEDIITIEYDGDLVEMEWSEINDAILGEMAAGLLGADASADDLLNAGLLLRTAGGEANRDRGILLITRAMRAAPDRVDEFNRLRVAILGADPSFRLVGAATDGAETPGGSGRPGLTLAGPGGEMLYLGRPRLFVRGEKVKDDPGIETFDDFKKRASSGRCAQLKALIAQNNDCPGSNAAMYRITGDKKYADKAVALLQRGPGDLGWYHIGSWLIPRSVAYDWMHGYEGFTDEKKVKARAAIKRGLQAAMSQLGEGRHLGSNASLIPFGAAFASAVALYGDDPEADSAFKRLVPMLEKDIAGILKELNGGWHESYSYYMNSADNIAVALDIYRSFSGRDLWRLELDGEYPFNQMIRGFLNAMRPNQTWVRWGDIVSGTKASTEQNVANWLLPCIRSTQDPELAWMLLEIERLRRDRTYFDGYALLGLLMGTNDLPPAKEPPSDHSIVMGRNSLGQVIMRSGWSADSSFVSFRCGDYNGPCHDDYNMGAFTIFCKGPLAIDSGTYATIGSPHYVNYKKAAIAHNVILAGEPGESGDEGGQRDPRQSTLYNVRDLLNAGDCDMGDIIAYKDAGTYVYVAGDVSRAYNKGIKKWTREMVYLRPDTLIICDKVSADAGTEKRFLLHTVTEPKVTGNQIQVSNMGFLNVQSLLPMDAKIRVIGGPGKEFWAKGKNWNVKIPDTSWDESGNWRAEIYQAPGSSDVTFITAMTFGPSNIPSQATYKGGLVTVKGRTIQFAAPGNVVVK
ncbi:MAG: heparinase II/III family protein [Planctomycetota bacterium]